MNDLFLSTPLFVDCEKISVDFFFGHDPPIFFHYGCVRAKLIDNDL